VKITTAIKSQIKEVLTFINHSDYTMRSDIAFCSFDKWNFRTIRLLRYIHDSPTALAPENILKHSNVGFQCIGGLMNDALET
jgi:hypothetical protein